MGTIVVVVREDSRRRARKGYNVFLRTMPTAAHQRFAARAIDQNSDLHAVNVHPVAQNAGHFEASILGDHLYKVEEHTVPRQSGE